MLLARAALPLTAVCAVCAFASACSLNFDRFQRQSADASTAGSAGTGSAGHAGGGAGHAGSGGQGGAVAPDASVDAHVPQAGASGSAADGGGPCTADKGCAPQVCELGQCVQCRDQTQCRADELCVSQRCVPDRKPSRIWMSAGGGVLTGTGYKLRVGLGTPEPMGRLSATGYKLSIGPALQQH